MDPIRGVVPILTHTQFMNVLRIEFARARRYGYPLCAAVIEIDGLDRINAGVGAASRDEILRQLVTVVSHQSRLPDTLALSHDRLLALLPHTPLEGATAVAERWRQSFRPSGVPNAHPTTLSIGLAAFESRSTIFFDSILKAAESAIAQAKAAGGDRIVAASSGTAS